VKALEAHEQFGLEAVRIVERPDPVPGPGQVVLRSLAWSLNYRDLLDGGWTLARPRSAGAVLGRRRPHGGHGRAATLPTAGVTAWNAVVRAGGIEAGQVLVVTGTGGVSLLALQVARLAGARVVVTSGSDAKLERVHALGAAAGVNSRRNGSWPVGVETVAPGGAHVVVDTVGALDLSVQALRLGGTVSFVGFLQGGSASVDLVQLMNKSARVHAVDVGSRRMFEELNAALALHEARPVVDSVFGFHEATAALRQLESGRHFGKVCLAA
jgi:NADPH:quinone reductase-like Zn-dependent oxidoreductase